MHVERWCHKHGSVTGVMMFPQIAQWTLIWWLEKAKQAKYQVQVKFNGDILTGL